MFCEALERLLTPEKIMRLDSEFDRGSWQFSESVPAITASVYECAHFTWAKNHLVGQVIKKPVAIPGRVVCGAAYFCGLRRGHYQISELRSARDAALFPSSDSYRPQHY